MGKNMKKLGFRPVVPFSLISPIDWVQKTLSALDFPWLPRYWRSSRGHEWSHLCQQHPERSRTLARSGTVLNRFFMSLLFREVGVAPVQGPVLRVWFWGQDQRLEDGTGDLTNIDSKAKQRIWWGQLPMSSRCQLYLTCHGDEYGWRHFEAILVFRIFRKSAWILCWIDVWGCSGGFHSSSIFFWKYVW